MIEKHFPSAQKRIKYFQKQNKEEAERQNKLKINMVNHMIIKKF